MSNICTKCKINSAIFASNNTWCKECKADYNKLKYVKKPKIILIKVCEYCKTNKSNRWIGSLCRNCYEKQHRNNNLDIKEKLKTRTAQYRNKEESKEKRRTYESNRLKINPSAKLANRFRNLINKLVKNKKGKSAEELLGCTYDELELHLRAQFKEDMSWNNWNISGWHIDHIKPLASFDLTNEEELKKAFHYTNLQPLWAIDNLKKGDKYNEQNIQELT